MAETVLAGLAAVRAQQPYADGLAGAEAAASRRIFLRGMRDVLAQRGDGTLDDFLGSDEARLLEGDMPESEAAERELMRASSAPGMARTSRRAGPEGTRTWPGISGGQRPQQHLGSLAAARGGARGGRPDERQSPLAAERARTASGGRQARLGRRRRRGRHMTLSIRPDRLEHRGRGVWRSSCPIGASSRVALEPQGLSPTRLE